MSDFDKYRDALAKIAQVASAAISGDGSRGDDYPQGNGASDNGSKEKLVCTPKFLPRHLLLAAAKTAIEINPVNAPMFGPMAAVSATGFAADRMRAAVVTAKYWGPAPRRLTVSFMESTSPDLRSRIINHLNAWTRTGGIRFVETQGTGDVRISRGPGGYWSYLGTDILLIQQDLPTMNLEDFSLNTSESEYRRVVRHEAGHTLGMAHEHMRRDLVARIDPEKAYDYFLRTQDWDRRTVDEQVLTPLDERSLMSTPADQTSIMCYQLPGSITRDGRPITGGDDINQTDFDFVGRIYPRPRNDLIPPQERFEGEYAGA